MRPPACFDDPETRRKIEALCKKHGVDLRLLTDLCEVVQSYSGSGRRDGITENLREKLNAFIDRNSESSSSRRK